MNAPRRDLKIAPRINALSKRPSTKTFQPKNIPGSPVKLCPKEPGEIFATVQVNRECTRMHANGYGCQTKTSEIPTLIRALFLLFVFITVHRFLQRRRGEVTKYVKLPCDPREVDGQKHSRFPGQTVPKGTWCEFPDWLDARPMDLCSRTACNHGVCGPQGCHYRLSTTTIG